MDEKTMLRLMQEEKEKLLVDVKEAVQKRKSLMITEEPETGFENFVRK